MRFEDGKVVILTLFGNQCSVDSALTMESRQNMEDEPKITVNNRIKELFVIGLELIMILD